MYQLGGYIGFAKKIGDSNKILYTALRDNKADLYRWAKREGLKIFKIQSLADFIHEEGAK